MFPWRIFQVSTLQSIDLSNNPLLHGSLPEFTALSSLQTFVLSFTNFLGTLPDSIGYLSNLSRLELVNCSFHGKIPNSMMNLSQLVCLDFSSNEFSGPIPSFSNSRNLTQIILSHNALTGEINGTQWRYLQNLEILDLRYNSLQGGIPSGLLALPQIQKIQLSNNQFFGQVQLTESSDFSSYQLDTLDLSNNNLDGPFPTAFFQFPELKYLSLSFNNFSGSFDINMVQIVSSLSYLDLSRNSLGIYASQNASAIRSFPQMSTLKLASCHLKTIPGFLRNQSKLMYLDLSNNEIGGAIPKWIWTLRNLLYLNLSSNFLEDMETAIVPNLASSLSILDLHSNRLTGKMPPLPPFATYVDYSSNQFSLVLPNDIGKDLSVAIFFSLSNNSFEGNVPESICQAGYLQVLDLSANSFKGRIPPCLVNVASLKVLNLRNNNLNGSIPEGFPATCGLKTLDLSRNQLQGQIPHSLSNCRMLEVLDVRSNQMDGGFPCHLKNTTELRVLVLRGNRFSGQIGCPENNGTWNQLQIVDLADDDFRILPPARCLSTWKAMQANDNDLDRLQSSFLELSGLYYQDTVTVTVKGLTLELTNILKVFTSIDLSGNRIEGKIPEVLGTFKSLRLLNMSRNELSGPIPPSLGGLQVLESLDLSRNFLTGSIPLELANLSFLSLLNLSYNQLVGPVPKVRQFVTFENSSYEGNAGLCGIPLTRGCTNTEEPEAEEPESSDWEWSVLSFWHFMIVGYGLGIGVAVTACLHWSKGEQWINGLASEILAAVLPKLGY